MIRLASGDEKAMDQLVCRFRRRVTDYAFRLIGSEDAAEDVAQDVFVRVWTRRSRWRPGGSVVAYLFRVTRNLALNRMRSETSRAARDFRFWRDDERSNPTPAEHLDAGELQRRVMGAIDALPPRRSEVLVRARLERSSHTEIARAMGISLQTVANHLTRATSDLRALLSD